MRENQGDLINTSDDPLDLLERVDEAHLPSARWPQMLADFVDVLVAAYERAGLDGDSAIRYARTGVLALAEYQGGRLFYLPRGDSIKAGLRDDAIWREFDGRNITALAKRYDVSERHVYRVLAQQKAMRLARRQGRLFSEPDQ